MMLRISLSFLIGYCDNQEEKTHAQKFYRFLNEKEATVKLLPIECPKQDWNNPVEVFEEVVAHEELVTASINNIADVAMREKDHATLNMLQWFIGEQVEEESVANDILCRLKMIKGEGSGMFHLDKELALVTFVDATLTPGA